MKKILACAFLGLPMFVYSQGRLVYSYDNAGNRISRVVNTSMYAQLIENDSVQQEFAREEDVFEEEFQAESLQYRKIRISPNPTEGKLKIALDRFEDKDKCVMRLYSVDGSLVSSININKATTPLDITSQPAGLYLMHIRLNEKETVWKIIKK